MYRLLVSLNDKHENYLRKKSYNSRDSMAEIVRGLIDQDIKKSKKAKKHKKFKK